MRTLKMALIGTGNMGRKYARMIASGSISRLELAAVVCRSGEAAAWAKEQLPESVRVFRSAEELYAEAGLFEAVLIATPHRTHEELALEAFEKGFHVFCDKPAGVSVQQARRMSLAAEAAGLVYGVMFHQRLYPKYRRIRELLDQGAVGEIRRVALVNSRYFRTARYHRSGSWRSSWAGEGGGALINQGQHLLDVWQWLFGMPLSVYARIPFGKYNDFAVDDEASILFEYPQNMTASFLLTTGEGDRQERLEIVGSGGKIELDGDRLSVKYFQPDLREYAVFAATDSREGLEIRETVETYPTAEEPYGPMLENFALAVLEGSPLVVPGQEAERALELANAAYMSAWTGQPVALPVDGEQYDGMLEERAVAERRAAAKLPGGGPDG